MTYAFWQAQGHNGVGRAGEVMSGTDQTQETVARLLEEMGNGDGQAFDQLFAILYDELKELAGRHRRRWRGHHTLNTTVLVHEAYLKLVGQSRIEVDSQAHFRALGARAMRQILCNYARDHAAQKRGGPLQALPLDELWTLPDPAQFSEAHSANLVALDEVLQRLERVNPRQARVVECRFFGGLTVEETATAIGASTRTVKRDWAMAQAWLHREMESGR
ncbi:MAG TPA: ECF-type sigma factor [Xanthomonadaceae bacterium]|nr:ECF-type sigma factor [Xanthomonadaceae bacterium]